MTCNGFDRCPICCSSLEEADKMLMKHELSCACACKEHSFGNLQNVIMNKEEFKNGIKNDEGKPRFELIAWEVMEAVARILTEGAKKYSDRNWEKGIVYGRVFSGVQRHLTTWWNSYLNGTDGINHEDGTESHLDHAITGLMFLSAYEKREMETFDDRPRKE